MTSKDEAIVIGTRKEMGATVNTGKTGRVLRVDFRSVADHIPDTDLVQGAELARLREIHFLSACVCDDGFKHLVQLTQLTALDLRHTWSTDAGLVILKQIPPLKLLLPSGSQASREDVNNLLKLMLRGQIVLL